MTFFTPGRAPRSGMKASFLIDRSRDPQCNSASVRSVGDPGVLPGGIDAQEGHGPEAGLLRKFSDKFQQILSVVELAQVDPTVC
ncbi:hypothetical protein EYF80_057651 [Liparis tanakae]|uniref:Uncharacterized protein n=1 Tax=Liparis tanakae TaxID=230148 RepID=A0A4Z2EUE5_9TELE|nr:hypothetical protein EYF80_057651 [Liparis tanakae]